MASKNQSVVKNVLVKGGLSEIQSLLRNKVIHWCETGWFGTLEAILKKPDANKRLAAVLSKVCKDGKKPFPGLTNVRRHDLIYRLIIQMVKADDGVSIGILMETCGHETGETAPFVRAAGVYRGYNRVVDMALSNMDVEDPKYKEVLLEAAGTPGFRNYALVNQMLNKIIRPLPDNVPRTAERLLLEGILERQESFLVDMALSFGPDPLATVPVELKVDILSKGTLEYELCPIEVAVECERINIVEKLIEAAALSDAFNLHLVFKLLNRASIPVIKAVLGAIQNFVPHKFLHKNYLLLFATQIHQSRVAEALLERGADPCYECKIEGLANEKEKNDICKVLKEMGFYKQDPIPGKLIEINTAIVLAAVKKRDDILKIMLDKLAQRRKNLKHLADVPKALKRTKCSSMCDVYDVLINAGLKIVPQWDDCLMNIAVTGKIKGMELIVEKLSEQVGMYKKGIERALGKAADMGHFRVVQSLLNMGKKHHLELDEEQLAKALVRAVTAKQVALVKSLLAAGASSEIDVIMNTDSERKVTAISAAALTGDPDMVKILICSSEWDTCRNSHQESLRDAAGRAIEEGHFHMIPVLLSLGLHPDTQDNDDETTLLHTIICKPQIFCTDNQDDVTDIETRIAELLRVGTDLNILKNDGSSVLETLIKGTIPKEAKCRLLSLFLEHGANALKIGEHGENLLQMTLLFSQKETQPPIADILIKHCPCLMDLQDSAGETALSTALYTTANFDVANKLVDQGCRLDVRLLNGNTLLHFICDSLAEDPNHDSEPAVLELAKKLLQKGLNPGTYNAAGVTPVWYAVKHGYPNLLQLLLQANASVTNFSVCGIAPDDLFYWSLVFHQSGMPLLLEAAGVHRSVIQRTLKQKKKGKLSLQEGNVEIPLPRDVWKWMESCCQPHPLLHCCRLVIRNCLGPGYSISTKFDSLVKQNRIEEEGREYILLSKELDVLDSDSDSDVLSDTIMDSDTSESYEQDMDSSDE